MQVSPVPISAAIDIGSNTVRVVVARCTSSFEILAADEALVRLGESVNATGTISEQKYEQTRAVLRSYLDLAEQYSAQPVLAVATEAVRRASNADTFLTALQRDLGLVVHVLPPEAEATLTFYGATSALTRNGTTASRVAVLDLGGGSTELVLAEHGQIGWRTSLQLGSGWLHDRYSHADPPTLEDSSVAYAFLQTYFQGLHIKRFPAALIATGGSANALYALAQRAFAVSSAQQLSRDDLLRCEGLLCALPANEIAQRYALEAGRVRILQSGALILRAFLERFKLNKLRISAEGIREGVLHAYTRYGAGWLEQAQMHPKARVSQEMVAAQSTGSTAETFAQVGRGLLEDRLQKLVAWREDVLKNEDIEAVHKMRVASRRLRAVLDAYESICDPVPFKLLYRQIKSIAGALGDARDIDVMIQYVQSMEQLSSEEHAGAQWLVARLSGYRRLSQKKLVAHLKQLDAGALQKLLAECFSSEDYQVHGSGMSHGLDSQASNAENARIIVNARLDEVYSWERFVDDPARIYELHRLRIAAKRLRYTLETFASELPAEMEEALKEVSALQEELGALHDNDVMSALLRVCVERQDGALDAAELSTLKTHYGLRPALLQTLLNQEAAPAPEQLQGLALLARHLQSVRTEQYGAFRQHWLKLQEQNFQQDLRLQLQALEDCD